MDQADSQLSKRLDGHRRVPLVLLLLLGGDILFMAVHTFAAVTPSVNNPLLSLEIDGSYPEVYQYVKWFCLALLFASLSISRRSSPYLAWAIVFAYLLCDDALNIHENLGAEIATGFPIVALFGLRLQDMGELAVTTAAGAALLSLVVYAYLRASHAFKKMTQDMLLLVLALAFFGVAMDMIHMAIQWGWKVSLVLGVIEDGGEMAVASLMVSYVFLQTRRDASRATYLVDVVQPVFARQSA